MNTGTFILSILFTLFSFSIFAQDKQELNTMISHGLETAKEQSLLMAKELESVDGTFPKSVKNGKLETSTHTWWCCGFFPGTLWYLYEYDHDPSLKSYAELYTARVEPVKNITHTHDLGFMLYCSFGNGYRITQNPQYLDIMKTGAQSLATRFNPEIGAIRSWDFNRKKWQFPVIIDNMMNLEFFSFISKETGDQSYITIANAHALKTMEHHFREDYSSCHVVSYDTLTGLPHLKQTHQGIADSSAWARGQAWGLYGFSMMARETGNDLYLQHARNIAQFIIKHPSIPEDKIPYWDFDDPAIPNAPRDASAAAIIASALIEMSQLLNNSEGEEYLRFAIQILTSLSSPEYLAEIGTNNYFILKHGTGNKPQNGEVDAPLSYADYYYVEALLRLKELGK
ncbi:glycoside hydrolase family 88 protein [Bacteroidales bacterium OttesenSCG-928-B11]|nr:glycoside hydrolase family 88 protein [Bacteroidales bacterium OttesenSCG-928-B11]MDL2325467.1 glycoside hydrolase family 88 protein [Bacteroidales bacterium OttesenSCG-928-A14]